MTTEKYPVQNTKYPTAIDEIIAEKMAWLKKNNRSLWEYAQTPPSEISFKIYMAGFVLADMGNDLEAVHASKKDEDSLPPIAVTKELYANPDITIEDLEWLCEQAKGTPAYVTAKKRIADFKAAHGIA